MRVLFIPFALPTHYTHQVPLAWALRAAGHEVRVAAAQPAVLDAITGSGMIATQIGGGYNLMGALAESVRGGQEGPPPAPGEFREKNKSALDEYGQVAELMAVDLLKFARWWEPDLVIADPMVTIAPLVTETLGIPLVRNLFGPDVIRNMGFPGSGAPVHGDPRERWPGRLVEIFDRFKVDVLADYAVRTLDSCPDSLQLPGTPNRVPMRFVPYNGSGTVPDWLTRKPERPRVCVTWGTMTGKLKGRAGFHVPEIIASLATLDVEIVAALSASDRELVGELPAGVRVVEQLPLHLLLPTCDALFQQGGTGAMLTAASLGVPQVILGQIRDEIFNADLLEAGGAGLGLSADDVDTGTVTAAVSRLLTDENLRAGARKVQEEIQAQPSPAEIVKVLEELVV